MKKNFVSCSIVKNKILAYDKFIFLFYGGKKMDDFKDGFKQANFSKQRNFSKILTPFISGVVGASLVVGICFGVPSIKTKLLGNQASNNFQTSTSSSLISSDLVDLVEYSNTSVAVAQKVLPSIVGIKIKYTVNSVFGSGESEATGSGIIISEDGYIITNNHVVSTESSSSYYAIEEASSMKVNLYNDPKEYDAEIIGTDEYTDLAVIKINASDLTPATLGNSDNVHVGEFAMAIGCPLGLESTVTSGIISAINRTVDDGAGTEYTCIQTDAAINSGNSGGALVNSNGEVIGINTLKLSGTGVEGMGFAIPINSTTDVVDQLIQYQTVKRPYIGISGVAVDEDTAKKYNLPIGVYVYTIEKNSPAEKAGLQKGDVITKIEGTEVKNINELNKVKNTHNIGDTITLSVHRNGEDTEFKISLEEMPKAEEKTATNEEIEDSLFNRNNSRQNSGSLFDFFNQ